MNVPTAPANPAGEQPPAQSLSPAPASFRDLALKAGNYLVEDVHLKLIFFLGLSALGYGALHPELAPGLDRFAAVCGVGLGAVAITK